MSENPRFEQLVRTQFPFPISQAYTYTTGRRDPEERYQAALACFEVALKYTASIALANFLQDAQEDPGIGNAHLFQELLDRLSRPVSLGHWQDILHLTLRTYATRQDKLVIPELFDFYYRVTDAGNIRVQSDTVQLLQRLVQERNEDAHHRNRALRSLYQRQKQQRNIELDLMNLLDKLRFLANYRLFYTGPAQYRDGCWHYLANSARGAEHPFPQETWTTTFGVDSNHCLLSNESGASVLDLYPFLIVTSEGSLAYDDMFFFDGIFSSGQANFLSYHAGVYIDESDDEGSPSSLATDAINSLLSFLQRQTPAMPDEDTNDVLSGPSTTEIYSQAIRWASENGERQDISLDALRQMLKLTREEALQEERALQTEQGIETEPEAEIPFEGEPTWANLAYYILDNSDQEEIYYKEIAAEAAQLRNEHDPNWQLGDSANVNGTISYTLSRDPRFYKLHPGYYRLTKHNELLSNPSWANLAYFVLQNCDQKDKGIHVQEITEQAIELKQKYSDWRKTSAQTPANTVSATMSVDHRFKPQPERGYWRLAEWEEEIPQEQPASTESPMPARNHVYENVLTHLAEMGTLEPLPFGRTYYTLDGKVHLMFRFSREHKRTTEREYFLGVTPQYFERIRQMGQGFMIFVLGSSENVLVVSADEFAAWVQDTEPSGSGTWPLAFYQSENRDRTERWVPGAGREDVSGFLNDYDGIRRVLAPARPSHKRRRRSPSIRMPDLIQADLLRAGDSVYVQNHPTAKARVIDARWVEYQGKRLSYNDWGMLVTGWSSINIYPQTILERTGQTLDELRKLLDKKPTL